MHPAVAHGLKNRYHNGSGQRCEIGRAQAQPPAPPRQLDGLESAVGRPSEVVEKAKMWLAADERRSTRMENKLLIRIHRRSSAAKIAAPEFSAFPSAGKWPRTQARPAKAQTIAIAREYQ